MQAESVPLAIAAPSADAAAPDRAEVPAVVEKLIEYYLSQRDSEAERFIDLVHRIGIEPFKNAVYGNADQRAARRREPVAA